MRSSLCLRAPVRLLHELQRLAVRRRLSRELRDGAAMRRSRVDDRILRVDAPRMLCGIGQSDAPLVVRCE